MPRVTGKEIDENAAILKEVADVVSDYLPSPRGTNNKKKLMKVRRWILNLKK